MHLLRVFKQNPSDSGNTPIILKAMGPVLPLGLGHPKSTEFTEKTPTLVQDSPP